jgi:predicted metalloprotease
MRKRLLMGTAAAILPLTGLLLAGPAGADNLNAAVQTASQELRQAWQSDPATANQPWPEVVLLATNQRALTLCPEAPGAIADTSALYCPSSRQVLLDQRWLGKDVLERYGTWGIAYWIATALGQAIRSQAAEAGPTLSPAAANLQANCLAGVLLASRAALKPAKATQQLSPAHTAYAASDVGSQGTASQRAYALLSGFGATASSCNNGAMADLARDKVSDPKLLQELANDPDNRAMSSLSEALNSQCRKPPSCPRRIPEVYAN